MPLDLSPLDGASRLLLEAELKPVQGTRFQPTGFPNLGAAQYRSTKDTQDVLVESAQSMANRLEAVCWDEPADDWVAPLRGLPLVKVRDEKGDPLTNSVLEAHRLNSAYIENTPWFATLKTAVGVEGKGAINFRGKVYPALLRYDPNSLVHGFFLESIAGVIRAPRLLSAFIEASNVNVASSGGVKNDRVDAKKSDTGGAKEGYGNVPFSRDEFTAEKIVAYFNLDLAQLRGMGLGDAAERFLIAFSLYKIQALLGRGLRLRTACDLDVVELKVTRPASFVMPRLDELAGELQTGIEGLKGSFADPPATITVWQPKPTKASPKPKPGSATADDSADA